LNFFSSGFLLVQRTDSREHTTLLVIADGKLRSIPPISEVVAPAYLGACGPEKALFGCRDHTGAAKGNIYELHLGSTKAKLLLRNNEGFGTGVVSSCGQFLAITKQNGRTGIADLRAQRIEWLPAMNELRGTVVDAIARGGRLIYCRSEVDGGYSRAICYDRSLNTVDLVSKRARNVAKIHCSPGGRYVLIVYDAGGRTQFELRDTMQQTTIGIPDAPSGTSSDIRFSENDRVCSWITSSTSSPSAIYTYDLSTRKIQSKSPVGNPTLPVAERVRFRSFDGLYIPALLIRPSRPRARQRAVIWAHGGPYGQSRDAYDARLQAFALAGFTVLAVNYRGSAGYGKHFSELDTGQAGKADAADCIAGKQYLLRRGLALPTSVAIAGYSYGGYLALVAMAFHPKEFVGCVAINPVIDWVSLLECAFSSDPRVKILLRKFGCSTAACPKLRQLSPVRQAHRIQKPVLLIRGEHDPLAPACLTQAFANLVSNRSGGAKVVELAGEGHSFRTRNARRQARVAMIEFLNRLMPQQ
jgi:dipeptidyl aminopeptidase/acylaminoacyl peptidase